MGPETYGRYGLITSVSLWFAIVSGISAAQTMSRFVPDFKLRGDEEGLRKLLGSLLCLRLLSSSLAMGLYLGLTTFWFPELDLVALSFAALAILVRPLGKLLFALFLGLNQAARWGAGDTLGRWTSLILLVPAIYFGGLRGACLALLVTEVLISLLGLWWARSYLNWPNLRIDRKYVLPFLRFSLSFYASNVVLAVSQHSGEFLVRLASGDYVQVGYFNLAYRIYFLAAVAIWQFTMAFGPLLSTLVQEGKQQEVRSWVERLLKWMAMAGIFAVLCALLLARDLVPIAFGHDYLPVADNLLVLMVALLTYGLGSIARLLALTYDQPGTSFKAAAIHLTTFVGLGAPLVSWKGSLAGAIAVLAASGLYASYFTWRIRRVLLYSLSQFFLPVLLGALFVPLIFLRSTLVVNVALAVTFLVGYGSLLLLFRIVTAGEMQSMKQALRPVVVSEP
jgi:O-antigen/teichoic acid export membrane protein